MTGIFLVPEWLFVQAQVALGLTQREFADLLGCERRTIQRWQDRGGNVSTGDLLKLAAALDAVKPELAAECRRVASQDPTQPASPDNIARIVQAAATAMGTTPEAVRPAVEAAFKTAMAAGESVGGMVLGMTMQGVSPSGGA